MSPPPRVLAAVADPEIYVRLERLLRLADADVGQALDRETALALGFRQRFSLVISDLPLRGATLVELLASLAGAGALSAGCPVVLYGPPASSAVSYDGAGDISRCRDRLGLLRAVAGHLAIGDRVSRRLLVEMEIEVDSERVRRAMQTQNLSPTGMLLRTHRPLLVGTVAPFRLGLPRDPDPVGGRAEVVRHADPRVEGLFGMGVRFVALDGDGGERLRNFISTARTPAAAG